MSKKCNCGSMRTDITLKVLGMSCEHCKKAIETSVAQLPGVSKVQADISKGSVEVSYDRTKTNLEQIEKVIEDIGYELKEK